MKKISLKDSPMPEDKPKDEEHGEVQDVEVEPSQLLPNDWRYTTNHSKDLIIGDVNYSIQTPWFMWPFCFYFTYWAQ